MSSIPSVPPVAPNAPAPAKTPNDPAPDVFERTHVIAGLLAVGVGVFAIAVIAIVAIIVTPSGNGEAVAAIATGSVGVIGSVVGAYFGVKVGSDGRQQAEVGRQVEAAKAQVLAAHLPPDLAANALADAQRVARDVVKQARH